MTTTPELQQIRPNVYRLPRTGKMKVAGRVYASEKLLPLIYRDQSLKQLQDAACVPSVVEPVVGMPDIHEGFGLPIGGVMATRDFISAGAVGMDINCGVRLLQTSEDYNPKDYSPERLRSIMGFIQRDIPVGLGAGHKRIQKGLSLEQVVLRGSPYLVERGYGRCEDIERTEENGCLDGANWSVVTKTARKRGEKHIGTLGSGNHFIELQRVERIFNPQIAAVFGLRENQLCLMIHSGSRGLGHQTCVEYSKLFWDVRHKYGVEDIPNPKLSALPIDCPEGRQYYGAMAAAVNFAFANRQMMAHQIRQVFSRFVKEEFKKGVEVTQVYDVAHNIGKWEKWPSFAKASEGKEVKNVRLLVHRKGATRALPAGHPKNPEVYRETGHPVIIPGSMGTSSHVLVGTPLVKETFGSVNHGAGRTMSRTQAKRTVKESEFRQAMGKVVYNLKFHKIADEAPQAYKDIDEVVNCLIDVTLAYPVAKLSPLMVVKGD